MEFNIQKIKKTAYNYNYIGENNLKNIYNQWDLFLNLSLSEGNSHYAFTINYPNEEIHKLYNYEPIFKNILNIHPISKNEEIINPFNNKKYNDFDDLRTCYKTESSLWIDLVYGLVQLNSNIGLESWSFGIIEQNKQGIIHIHGLIAIKNLVDYNKNISINIINLLKEKYPWIDILIKNLNKFKDIKGWVRYLHENKQWVFEPHFYVLYKDRYVVERFFLDCYLKQYNLKNIDQEKYNTTEEDTCFYGWWNLYYGPAITIDVKSHKITKEFKGIRLYKNEMSENLIIDLICNYMYINDLFIYKENVYKKIQKSLISYEKLGSIKELFFDGFQNIIVNYFIINFPIHFNDFDFYFLIRSFKLKMENNILKIKAVANNIIEFDFSIMEFSDGIYDISNNLFINKDQRNFDLYIKQNKKTIKYYDKCYNRVRRDKPTNWIKGVMNALNNNKDDFIVLCLFIANLFQPINENSKKNFIYIHGPSNTGKTTYSTKVLSRYFGSENIGSIVGDSNFKFQDIQDKLFIILEEFKYRNSLSGEFLKLLGGERLLTSKKYSKDHINLENLKGLIISNNLIKEDNKEIDEALKNRLYLIKFINKILKGDININDTLLKEESNIIIYCNKVYFSFKKKKQNRLKQIINTNSSNKTYMNLIHKSKNSFSLYKYIYSHVINKIENKQFKDKNKFKMKFVNHTNSVFLQYQFINRVYRKTEDVLLLTNTTQPTENTTVWEIGKLKDNRIQYMNRNFMATSDEYTLKQLKEKSDMGLVDDISELIKNNKDKVNLIENDLYKIFNKDDILQQCINTKSKTEICIEMYNIKYGMDWVFKIEQIWFTL